MSKKSSIPGTADAWESGTLGKSDAHVRKTSTELENQIDDSLGLQAISIRLPKATIEAYKNLAEMHGVGYQPLMREAICRWADTELKMLLAGAIQSQRTMAKKKASKDGNHDSHETPPMKKAA
jgi:predicted DNA-binding protein